MNNTLDNDSLNFGKLSQYRNIIYGIAGITIVIFHYANHLINSNSALAFISKIYESYIGSVGVDVFFIMSGISMYNSLDSRYKNDKFNLLSFYSKRLQRIIIPYLLVAIPFWYVMDIATKDFGIKQYILDISFVSFFTNGRRSIWYVFAILCIYFVCPYIYLILKKCEKFKLIIVMTTICAICGINLILLKTHYVLYDNIEVMLTRIPAFIFGMYIGKSVIDCNVLKKSHMVYIVLMFVIDMVISTLYINNSVYAFKMLRRYTQILRAIVLLTIIVLVFNRFGHKIKTNFLEKCGECSLEIYLVHVTLMLFMERVDIKFEKLFMFVIYVVLITVFVREFNRIVKIINNKISFEKIIARK